MGKNARVFRLTVEFLGVVPPDWDGPRVIKYMINQINGWTGSWTAMFDKMKEERL